MSNRPQRAQRINYVVFDSDGLREPLNTESNEAPVNLSGSSEAHTSVQLIVAVKAV